MKKYRKKPIVIEAMQFKGDNWDTILHWMCSADATYVTKRGQIDIETLEGTMAASVGDFIIKGVHDEFYPCKPDIFKKTYEEVN